MIEVSVVIICMNNLKNLYPCLNSIRKYTTVSYETLVVAYLFSPENLAKVKADFPWVTFIESNEIRGFSENNNLALRQAKGKYCFVLNDDTEMKMDVVGGLVETIEKLPDNVAVVSPTLLKADGSVQYCGRPPENWKTFLLGRLHLINENRGRFVNKRGIFRSYNIIGAAFLIHTDLFLKMGWFDERFFFCPEDLALSTKLNNCGYECWVNDDVKIIHYEGMSSKSKSKIITATKPAAEKGMLMFLSNERKTLYVCLTFCCVILNVVRFLFHRIKSLGEENDGVYYLLSMADLHSLNALLNHKTPKEVFISYYQKIKKT